ncbi:MAG: glycosyltransferase [Bacteroidetes bacterium]|nr:glycosyltransferase [Bacteroidota bacterium]
MIDLSIIIVNYNVKEFILNLLGSLQPALRNISAEIIIVDNASEDDSVKFIREKYPDVKLIVNDVNIGFGRANNIGLEESSGKYILFLNPDTIVKDDTFTTMIKFFEAHPDAGMAGCKVLNPDGSFQLPCRRSFPGPWTSFTKLIGLGKLFPKSKLFARYNLTYLDENKTYEVDAVSGAFMMIKRDVYNKIGGFDAQFFMYGEDLDLCYRTQKANFKVYYVHSTEIIHYKGESTKRSSIDETNVFYNAMQLFVNKHFSSSFIVGIVLNAAIFVRKLIAFGNLYKLILVPAFIDLFVFASSVYAAELIHSNERWKGFPDVVKPVVYLLPAIFQMLVSFTSGGYKKNSLSILRILSSLAIGFVLLTSITFFLKQFAFSRVVLLLTYAIVVFLFTSWRIISKVVFKFGLGDVARKTRTLLVGFGDSALNIGEKLKANVNSYHNIIGLIETSKKEIGAKVGTYEVLGSIDTLKKSIIEHKIDEVIFSTDKIGYEKMFTSIADCQETNVEFLVTGHELDFMVGKSVVTMLDNMPFLKVQYNILSAVHRYTKLVVDFFIATILLLTIYPFVAIKKLSSSVKSEFGRFILQVPHIFSLKKSFVGPRKKSYHGELFLGKPGLTGFWYVDDLSNKSADDEDKINIFYAKNVNVWLDLEILGKTFSKFILKAGSK